MVSVDPEHNRAVVLDYKSGKSSQYADMRQMDLMSSLVHHHFTYVETVRAGLMFVVAKDLITQDYKRKDRLRVFSELDSILHQREVSHETGVFNPKTNFTCKAYCPVLTCPHNGRRG